MTAHLEKLLDDLEEATLNYMHASKFHIRQRIIDLFEGRVVIATDEEAFAKSSAKTLKLDDEDDDRIL